MSKERRDIDYLGDILEATQRILFYTQGMRWEDFHSDHRTQDAVIRNLEVIGEATKNLSTSIRAMHSHVPWKDIAGVRDRLIHHYFGVSNEIVWQIVQEDLPILSKQIEEIVRGQKTS